MKNKCAKAAVLCFFLTLFSLNIFPCMYARVEAANVNTFTGKDVYGYEGDADALDTGERIYYTNNCFTGSTIVNYCGSINNSATSTVVQRNRSALGFSTSGITGNITSVKLKINIVDIVGSPIVNLIQLDDNTASCFIEAASGSTMPAGFVCDQDFAVNSTNTISPYLSYAVTEADKDANGWYTFDVTSYVQGKIAANAAYVNFALTGDETVNGNNYFNYINNLETTLSAKAPKLEVTTTATPTVTKGNISISGGTGTGGLVKTGDTVTATWNNTSAGDNNSGVTGVTMDFSQFGGGTAVTAVEDSESLGTWTATYKITAGNIDATNVNVSVTATNADGDTTTADDTNAAVDNQAPTVTAGNISISGATGTGGVFKVGDTVTATWNNTSSGDKNSDISGVTVDFSQFGGGTAVTAANSSGTWKATYTITAGSIDATNINVSVTATDDAGYVAAASDDTNATMDNQAPTVTAGSISISGATGTGGVFKTGDTVTATWNNTSAGDNNSDISGVTVDFSQFGGGAAVTAENSSGTWTATYIIASGSIEGTNINVSVTATDNAGNATTMPDDTNAAVDNQAPTGGSISINGGSAYTTSTSVTLALSAAGAMEMIISEDSGFGDASYEPYAGSKSFTLSTGDGTKTVYVRYKDAAGNETSGNISDTVILATQPPTGGSISINGGAAYTNSTAITLTLSATGAAEMIISEDSGFGDASYEPYAASKSFTLSTGDGTKTVYVRYKDVAGNETSETISDTIILDTTAPTEGSISINSAAAYTNSTAVTLTLSATDATEMIISGDSGFGDASYEPYAASKSFTLGTGDGTKTVYVKYKDIAGNETSGTISDTIILDTTAPTGGSISINGGAAYTTSTAVTLTLSATGASEMIISEDSGFGDASYEPYAGSKSFALGTGDGTKTVYVRYKDAAGNETSTTISDTVILATQPPTDGSISINGGAAYTNSTAITLTLSATGAAEMIISEDSGFGDASYEPYAASKSFTLGTGDGTKTVYVRYKDVAGNETSETINDTIILDTTAPTGGSISINSGAAYTNSTAVTLTLSATDATEMMISGDSGFGGASYEPYAGSKSFTLSTGDGTKTVYVRYKDVAGNETSGTISDTIILDTTAPTGGSISINGGAAYTTSTAVTLTLSATDAAEMIISEDSGFGDASYEPYAASKSFTLSTGDGTKTVYVRYKDAAGNETSGAISDTVILATQPPTGGSISINSAAAYTNSTAVTLTLSATGAAEMIISEDSGFGDASYEPYAASKNFTLSTGDGTKTVYVKYKDVAGNETSETISDTIILDTTAPTGGSISINSAASYTNSTAVTLTLSATDAAEMMISGDSGFAGASYEPYAASKSFTLSTGDGTKTVYVRYKDIAGNETSGTISDTIILDTTAPTGGSISINGGAAYTTSTAVTLTLSATDAAEMIISEDSGFGDASYEPYAASKSFTLSTGDGTKTVYVRYKDAAGNETSGTISDTVILATQPPTGGSISINSAAAYTNSTAVTLTLSATGAAEMIISEDSGFAGVSYEPYATSKSFTLGTGDGTKTVYVRYKDVAGNETSETISDTIILDTTAPTEGSISINSAAAYTNSTAVTLTLSATDAAEMMISNDSGFGDASYEPYAASKSFTLSTGDGTKTVYVRYKDIAGNETSATISDTIILDTTAPVLGNSGIITLTDVTATGAILNWTKANDALSAQNTLQYLVYQSDSSSMDSVEQVKLGTALGSYTSDITAKAITGLEPGHNYYFNILVKDELGNEACYSKVQVYTPAPIGNLAAARGNGQVTLTFTAPTGATGIVVEQSANGIDYSLVSLPDTLSASSTSATVAGLTNGQQYYFRLTVIGGAYAGTSNTVTVTPATVPEVPVISSVTPGDSRATIVFTAPANNGGNAITSYTVTSNPGNFTATGATNSITVTGLTNGTAYTFTVTATNEVGISASSAQSDAVVPYSSDSGYTPSPTVDTNTNVKVELNGKEENIASAVTKTENNKTIVTVTMEQQKLDEKLKNESQKPIVEINAKSGDVVALDLDGRIIKSLEQKDAIVKIQTPLASYNLPAQQVDIDTLSAQLGKDVNLQDIKVTVEISNPSDDTIKVLDNIAAKDGYNIGAKPVEFKVKYSYGDKTYEINKPSTYVERTITIPDGVDPTKITTGIVLNSDGTVSHVPTKVVIADSKYYARINSLRADGVYSVIWHPKEFADVKDHWSKDSVNEMGSRLIIKGIDENSFAPDRAITRAEFAAIAVNALGLETEVSGSKFNDVKTSDWYSKAIATASKYNLIKGYSDTNFEPDKEISREEAMAIISRAMKIARLNSNATEEEIRAQLEKFVDNGNVSSWARESAAACVSNGLVTGSNNNLKPEDNITRAETAAIIMRLLKKADLI